MAPAAPAAAAAARSGGSITPPQHPDITQLLSAYQNFIKAHDAPADTDFQPGEPHQHQNFLRCSSLSLQHQQHASQTGQLPSSTSQDDSQPQQKEEDSAERGTRSTRSGAGKKKKQKMHSSTRARVRLADLNAQHQVRMAAMHLLHLLGLLLQPCICW
jgi:hypothetical protein